MKMTKSALFALSAMIGLPVYAADDAVALSVALSARGDPLGSGLAALWREFRPDSHPDSPAAATGFSAGRLPLVARSHLLFLPAGSMRDGGLGMAPSLRIERSAATLSTNHANPSTPHVVTSSSQRLCG